MTFSGIFPLDKRLKDEPSGGDNYATMSIEIEGEVFNVAIGRVNG